MKVLLFGQIYLPQSPIQDTFWVPSAYESIKKLVTQSEAPHFSHEIDITYAYLIKH